MKEIEGVSLQQMLEDTEKEIIQERKQKVSSVLRGIFTNIEAWSALAAKADKEAATLKEKIAKAKDRLQQIKGGNWNVIQEVEKADDPQKGALESLGGNK